MRGRGVKLLMLQQGSCLILRTRLGIDSVFFSLENSKVFSLHQGALGPEMSK